ncbi:hypothetical protein, partial [Ruegeria sp. HKCCD8929]|uniref:hypothetical protein n=1 Tax=Ruegeria sp. HKCCD8929 TaxID=2683006 RepID=UPI001C2BB805
MSDAISGQEFLLSLDAGSAASWCLENARFPDQPYRLGAANLEHSQDSILSQSPHVFLNLGDDQL